MSEISEQIIVELSKEQSPSHPIRVWYDPQQKYRVVIDEVADALKSQDVNFVRYDGSYLELKSELWQHDPDLYEQWAFYIPESQSDAEWFNTSANSGRCTARQSMSRMAPQPLTSSNEPTEPDFRHRIREISDD